MKTLKVMMMSLALLVVCGFANAKTIFHNPTKDEVIGIYTDAVVHGDTKGIDNAIDDDAQFNMHRGDHVNTLNKSQLIDYLKSNANTPQDCKITSSVTQDTDDTYVKKIVMQYGDVTRTDVVTAERAGDGWKITKVETSFK